MQTLRNLVIQKRAKDEVHIFHFSFFIHLQIILIFAENKIKFKNYGFHQLCPLHFMVYIISIYRSSALRYNYEKAIDY